MGDAKRDANYVTTLIAVSNADGSTPVTLYADPTTHRLLVSATAGTLDDLSDVTITSVAQGDIIYRNGSSLWVNLAAGTSGKFLRTNGAGANPSWETVTAGAAGSDTQVQFNDGGTNIGGDAGFVYNKTTNTATLDIIQLTNSGLKVLDTNASHYLIITPGSDITADRVLTLTTGDAARTVTISGNTTISQDYSTSGNPQFATVELGAASDTTISRAAAGVIAVEGASVATLSTAQTWTALQTHSLSGNTLRLVNTTDGASVQVARMEGDRATVAANDEAYASLMLSDDGGTQTEFGRITWKATTVTDTSEAGRLQIGVMTGGTLADEIYLTGAAISPAANDGLALGTSSLQFADLFLAEGGVINWDNGDATITQTNNVIAVAGITDLTLDAVLRPASNDGGTLGSTTVGWADLHLATGGVVNWANGEVTITAATDTITVAGATLLTGGTGLAVALGTVELGHASDTTLSRSAAGVLAVEGVAVLTVAGGTLTGSITLGENTGVALDPAGSADGKWSGITIAATSGYTQAFGDLVYLDPTDSRWEATDANAAAAADGDARAILGMVVSTGTDGNACTILLMGQIRADANFPALTVGAPVYVAETAGDIVVAQPTTTDAVIRIVGHALTADEIFFKPDNTWTTHT